MEFLHSKNIVHRDLKPENILLSKDYDVKVSDFGLSKEITETHKTMNLTGTFMYMAPELFGAIPTFTSKVDVYAYAIIFWEVMSQTRLQKGAGSSLMDIAMTVEGKRPEIPDTWDKKIGGLITTCWAKHPQDRPAFSEICPVLEVFLPNTTVGQPKDVSGSSHGTELGSLVEWGSAERSESA